MRPRAANFSGTPTSGTAPLAVSFTDTSSNSPSAWSWTFGDGGTSTAQNPSHTYTTPGSYAVTLTASNAGGSDPETKTNYISVAAPPDFTIAATPIKVTIVRGQTANYTVTLGATGGFSGSVQLSLTGQPSACGTVREVGTLTNRLPSDGLVTNPDHRAKAEKIWGLESGTIPEKPGYHSVDMFRALARGDLKAIWIQCTNPWVTMPNLHRFERKPGDGRFVVVSDIYPTPTTANADLILPSAAWVEREGMGELATRLFGLFSETRDLGEDEVSEGRLRVMLQRRARVPRELRRVGCGELRVREVAPGPLDEEAILVRRRVGFARLLELPKGSGEITRAEEVPSTLEVALRVSTHDDLQRRRHDAELGEPGEIMAWDSCGHLLT